MNNMKVSRGNWQKHKTLSSSEESKRRSESSATCLQETDSTIASLSLQREGGVGAIE
jgi:hypothetical protein